MDSILWTASAETNTHIPPNIVSTSLSFDNFHTETNAQCVLIIPQWAFVSVWKLSKEREVNTIFKSIGKWVHIYLIQEINEK